MNNRPRLVVLRGQRQNIRPAYAALFLQLLIDGDAAGQKVHTIPGEAADLPSPHTRKYRGQIDILKPVDLLSRLKTVLWHLRPMA